MKVFDCQNNREQRKRSTYARRRRQFPMLASLKANTALALRAGAEVKTTTGIGNTNINQFPTEILLNGIDRGVANFGRIGQRVLLTSMDMRCTVLPVSNIGQSTSLMMYVIWFPGKFSSVFTPPPSPVSQNYPFLEPIGYSPTTPPLPYYNAFCLPNELLVNKTFRILAKKRMTFPWWGIRPGDDVSVNPSWEDNQWDVHLELGFPVTFKQNNDDFWEIEEGVLLALFVGTGGLQDVVVRSAHRTRFVDF